MSIATEITRLQTSKANLKSSLENLDVTVSSSATLDDYPALMSHLIGNFPILYKYNWNKGWQSGGVWTYEYPSNNYSDIWVVQKDHYYRFYYTYPRGNRTRLMFTTEDITQISSGTVTGEQIYQNDSAGADNLLRMIPVDVKANLESSYWKAPDDGYAILTKTNQLQDFVRTLCIDYTDLHDSQVPSE